MCEKREFDRDDIVISIYESMAKKYKNYPIMIKIQNSREMVSESGGLIESKDKMDGKYLLSKDDIKELIMFGIEYGAWVY